MSVASDPVSGPPHLEPEDAHEPDVPKLAKWNHVPALGLGRVKPHEAAHRSALVRIFRGFQIEEG